MERMEKVLVRWKRLLEQDDPSQTNKNRTIISPPQKL